MGTWTVEQQAPWKELASSVGLQRANSQQQLAGRVRNISSVEVIMTVVGPRIFFFFDNLWRQDVLVFYCCYNQSPQT